MRRNRPFYDGFNEIAVGIRLLKEGDRAAECRCLRSISSPVEITTGISRFDKT
jgi:hypothetical protein